MNQVVESSVGMMVWLLAVEIISENWKSIRAQDSYFGRYYERIVQQVQVQVPGPDLVVRRRYTV